LLVAVVVCSGRRRRRRRRVACVVSAAWDGDRLVAIDEPANVDMTGQAPEDGLSCSMATAGSVPSPAGGSDSTRSSAVSPTSRQGSSKTLSAWFGQRTDRHRRL